MTIPSVVQNSVGQQSPFRRMGSRFTFNRVKVASDEAALVGSFEDGGVVCVANGASVVGDGGAESVLRELAEGQESGVAKDVGGRNHRGGASTVEDPSRIVVGLNNPGGEVGQWEGHEARVNDLGCHGGWSLLLTDEGTGLPLSLLLPLFGKGWHGGLLEAVVRPSPSSPC